MRSANATLGSPHVGTVRPLRWCARDRHGRGRWQAQPPEDSALERRPVHPAV